jgi:hypothetical protein
MGRLSGLALKNRTFHIQTELGEEPLPHVLSLVLLDGEVVLKRVQPAPPGAHRSTLERLIHIQHSAVEKELRAELESVVRGKARDGETPLDRCYRLFEEGLSAFRQGNHPRALELWAGAQRLFPSDRLLEVSIKIAKRRLARS